MVEQDDAPTPGDLRSFGRQLQEHGRLAVERSRRSLMRRLEEHTEKLVQIVASGGSARSVEREIATFRRQLSAIAAILGEMS
jgi:hypothetical protein